MPLVRHSLLRKDRFSPADSATLPAPAAWAFGTAERSREDRLGSTDRVLHPGPPLECLWKRRPDSAEESDDGRVAVLGLPKPRKPRSRRVPLSRGALGTRCGLSASWGAMALMPSPVSGLFRSDVCSRRGTRRPRRSPRGPERRCDMAAVICGPVPRPWDTYGKCHPAPPCSGAWRSGNRRALTRPGKFFPHSGEIVPVASPDMLRASRFGNLRRATGPGRGPARCGTLRCRADCRFGAIASCRTKMPRSGASSCQEGLGGARGPPMPGAGPQPAFLRSLHIPAEGRDTADAVRSDGCAIRIAWSCPSPAARSAAASQADCAESRGAARRAGRARSVARLVIMARSCASRLRPASHEPVRSGDAARPEDLHCRAFLRGAGLPFCNPAGSWPCITKSGPGLAGQG